MGSAAGRFSAGRCQCRATITQPRWGAKKWGQGNQNAESAKNQHPRSILVALPAAKGRGDVLLQANLLQGIGQRGFSAQQGFREVREATAWC